MIPVPSYQVVEFLEWLSKHQFRINQDNFQRERLKGLAIEYIRGGIGVFEPRLDLKFILRIFQSCPMVREPSFVEQLDHFCGCGQCLEHIEHEGRGFITHSLHPLLDGFLSYSENNGFQEWIERKLNAEFDRDEDRRSSNDTRWFRKIINIIGPQLNESFRAYLSEVPGPLVRDFEVFRSSSENSINIRRRNKSHKRHNEIEEGAEPISSSDNVENAAYRLVASVQELVSGGYYDNIIATDHQLCRFLSISSDLPENLAQSLEFLSWLWKYHPKINIIGDIPSERLSEFVQLFCEAKGYSNVSSFNDTVKKWVKGESSPNLLHRIQNFIRRNAPSKALRQSNDNSFERYKTVRMHAMFLFLSLGDFPTFIDKYWPDLNALTGDLLDIYYSKQDLKIRVSGYETLTKFKSLNVGVNQLPAIILWQKSLEEARAISLGNLPHDEIMDVMKILVHRIAEGDDIDKIQIITSEHICVRQRELKLTSAEYVNTKIIINGGDNIMNDKYDISGQTGAVGPNAHVHHTNFNQVWNNVSKKIDLESLVIELPQLRKEMKSQSDSPEHDLAIGAVANAEIAAKSGDGSAVLQHLKTAGKWTLSCAEKIGTGVAVVALKTALGI